MPDLTSQARTLAAAARDAAPALAVATGAMKNAALAVLAEKLDRGATGIRKANAKDLKAGKEAGLSAAMLDRLEVTPKRLEAMATGVREVMQLPDPVGQIIDGAVRPNGLQLRRVRVPLGVALMIYESRPNVTVDAASLCLKSGNAVILRGGKEAQYTNRALGNLVSASLKASGLPSAGVQVVKSTDRRLVPELLALEGLIDIVIPRGGKGLIRTVVKHSAIPVLRHLDGVCHVYVDESADPDMAEAIALNAKVQRPGVCNAMETLLVHKRIAKTFLPACLNALRKAGVKLRGDAAARRLATEERMAEATEEDWRTEYLELILSVRVVDNLDQAIAHISTYGSGHTDAIVTGSVAAAERFKRAVDSSSVMVNASTRFSDGGEYGLGAEIGISTNKLHARGPVGLEGLTTYKWVVEGEGQIRT